MVLTTRPYKVRGVKHVELTWTGLDTVSATVKFNGSAIQSGLTISWDHNLNSKGGGSYTYEVCADSGSPCSGIENVVF